MFGSALGGLLPLAIGIAISPIPIIACILMLFSTRGRANGPAFLVGWVIGIAVVLLVAITFSDATDATDATTGPSLADYLILLLGIGAILLGIRQWRMRPKAGETAVMPAWMAAINDFAPGKALAFGVLLSALNPKNLALGLAAGLVIDEGIANGGSEAALIIVFTVIASLSIAVPLVYVLVGGESAKRTLEGWRTWLSANNAALMTVLFIVIGANLVGTGLDADLR
jgi:threonine/homoserine/homoserine lactone efflux protein